MFNNNMKCISIEIVYMIYEVIRDRKNTLCLVALTWFLVYFLFWMILYLLFDRITWRYHYNLLIPPVALALGYTVNRVISVAPLLSNNRLIKWGIMAIPLGWLIAHFVVFWIMTPIVY